MVRIAATLAALCAFTSGAGTACAEAPLADDMIAVLVSPQRNELTDALVRAITAHVSDLSVRVAVVQDPDLAASLREQVAAARRLAAARHLRAVLWCDPERCERLFVFIPQGDPQGDEGRLLVRDSEKRATPEGTQAEGSATESLAVIARHAVRAILLGKTVGESVASVASVAAAGLPRAEAPSSTDPRTDPTTVARVPPPPASTRAAATNPDPLLPPLSSEPSVSSTRSTGLSVAAAYRLAAYAPQAPWTHGLGVGLHVWPGEHIGATAGLRLVAPVRVDANEVELRLHLSAFRLAAAGRYALGDVTLSGAVGAVVELLSYDLRTLDAGLVATDNRRQHRLGINAELGVELALLSWLRGGATLGVDYYPYSVGLGIDGASERRTLLEPSALQPDLQVSLAVDLDPAIARFRRLFR